MLIRIESCGECPAFEVTGIWNWCKVKGSTLGADKDPTTVPSWCPLRSCEVEDIRKFKADLDAHEITREEFVSLVCCVLIGPYVEDTTVKECEEHNWNDGVCIECQEPDPLEESP